MNGSGATALIVGDMQAGIIGTFAFSAAVLPVLEPVIPAARGAGVLVVYIRTGLRSSGVGVPARNALLTGFHRMGTLFHEESAETLVSDRVRPLPDEPVVLKRRTSAFAGTELDQLLRAQGIDSLVLTGVATSAMIAATLYDAADRDYRVTVLSDACADADPGIHDFLVERVFPARGVEVRTADAWIGGL